MEGIDINHWIDISQLLNDKTPCWPGDTGFSYCRNNSIAEGDTVNVGEIKLSTHLGTHIDAPYHFDDKGAKIHELDLELYVGKALVVRLDISKVIGLSDFTKIDLQGVNRLLISTGKWKDRSQFPNWIPAIAPELASYLAEQGVRLLGLDLPSVDELDSTELPAHHELNKYGIHILEGLVLENVEPGYYELIALPLAIEDGDGSPVRAVVRKLFI